VSGRALAKLHRGGAFAVATLPWWWFALRDLGPWADVVAIFLSVVLVPVALAVAVAVVVRRLGATFVAGSWVLFAAVALAGPWWPAATSPPAAPLRLVAANVLGANREVASAATDLVSQHPDVLVVSEDGAALDTALRASFDHALTSDPRGRGTGVYSDLPIERLALPARLDARRGVRVRVDAPSGPFVLYAIHLPRPWPYQTSDFQVTPTEYRRVIGDVLASVRAERLPVVIAGDLNLVDRTSSYRDMTSTLRDAMRSSWAGPTSRKWWPLLARIDHIFESPGWCSSDAHRFTITGSDHRGVTASIGPCVRAR
jgi:endonuclease/exonuclease/phosphatase (EEP) superfamily protein YafD